MALNLAFGSLYAWSIFVLPLEREFGWKRADTAWVYTIAILFTVTATVISGRLQDRQGPRVSVIVGGLLLAGGYFLSSFTTSLWMLYVSFGIVGGFGGGFGYAAPMPVASKWFPDKRGLVVGVMVGAYAAASAIFGSIATYLIGAYGWRIAFRLLAALFVLVTIFGASLLENPPEGYRPPNCEPPAAHKMRATVPTGAMIAMPMFWSALDRVLLWAWPADGHQPASCRSRRVQAARWQRSSCRSPQSAISAGESCRGCLRSESAGSPPRA